MSSEAVKDRDYLVYILILRFLAQRVALINVRHLLQHFANLLGKLDVGGGEAYGNLHQ